MQYGSHKEYRLVTDHNFGFGIITTPTIRLWVGPNLRFGFVKTISQLGICMGVGFTGIGLNYNLGSTTTLGMELGFLYGLDFYLFHGIDYTPDDYGIYGGLNNIFVLKMSILFSNNDTYNDFYD